MFCVDPRDRVYALLALLSPEGRSVISIVPDYTKTNLDVLQQVIVSFEESGHCGPEVRNSIHKTLRDMLCLWMTTP
jgi:hypothetical protein